MQWVIIFSRVLLFAAIGAGIGWFYGQPAIGLSLAMAGLALFWALQMGNLQQWLDNTAQVPTDWPGLWG